MKSYKTIINFSLILILLNFPISFANGKSAPSSFADLAEKLMPSVVNISSTQIIKSNSNPFPFEFPPGSPFEDMFKDFNKPTERKATALGSGFIIDKEGIVVTNNHVIQGAEDILVSVNGSKEYKAKVLGTDPYMDLAGLDFTDVDLSNANFSGADLSGTIFINANLTNTIFTDAELAGVNLTNATLDDNQLDDALFNGTTGMEAALASGVILTGTVYAASMNYSDVVNNDVSPAGLDLTGQDFSDYDLSSLDFTDAELAGGIFTNATISDDQLDVALFNGVSGVDAAIDSGAIFTNTYSSYEVGQNYNDVVNNDVSPAGLDLTGQDFSQYDLTGLDFTDAELGGAIFNDAIITDDQLDTALFEGVSGTNAALVSGATFNLTSTSYEVVQNSNDVVKNNVSPAGLYLVGANFIDDDLSGKDFTGANLADARFNRANLTGTIFTDATLTGAKFNRAKLIDADLSGSILTGAVLNRTNLAGAVFNGATITNGMINSRRFRNANLVGVIVISD